jgi:hypothetical protein
MLVVVDPGRIMFGRSATALTLAALFVLGFAVTALAHSIPGHNGHAGTNVPADPGAGRHRVSEHGTSLKQCASSEHIRVSLKITVASGGVVDLNAAEVESSAPIGGADNWASVYDGTIEGDLGFGIFSDGTHTVIIKHMPDSHNHGYEWHVAMEVVGENADPDLDSVFISRACVDD